MSLLHEKLVGSSVEVLMVDEEFFDLARDATEPFAPQEALELTAGAYLKAKQLCVKLKKCEEREEDELVKAESAMEKAQHFDCDEVCNYIAEQMVNHEFALEALQDKSACVRPFVTHREAQIEARLQKWAKDNTPKDVTDERTYHPFALAYAKKNKVEYWKAEGTGKDGKVMLCDIKTLPSLVDPLTTFGLGGMPDTDSELLDGERAAFTALYEMKEAKAAELQTESYKVAQDRSLCEMVRRVPASLKELPLCWGFGGIIRVQKYGQLFLDVLAPFADDLHAVHEAARAEYAAKAPDSVKAEEAEAKNEAKKRKRR